jgi:hypothetical protein
MKARVLVSLAVEAGAGGWGTGGVPVVGWFGGEVAVEPAGVEGASAQNQPIVGYKILSVQEEVVLLSYESLWGRECGGREEV